jgi:hypothetical protein
MMLCEPLACSPPFVGYVCRHCQRPILYPEHPPLCLCSMPAPEPAIEAPPAEVLPEAAEAAGLLDPAEVADLFPGDSDPTLLGNKIRELCKAIGLPPCRYCDWRRRWINAGQLWLRGEWPPRPGSSASSA